LRFAVGFGEVGFPFKRARELWKKRIEDLSLWRIVDVCEEEDLAWEVNVNEVEALGDAVDLVVLKVLCVRERSGVDVLSLGWNLDRTAIRAIPRAPVLYIVVRSILC
jgi:hypothetical protein